MRNLLCVVSVACCSLGAPHAITASCFSIPAPLEASEQADFVFSGTVTEVDEHPDSILERGEDPPTRTYRATFQVDRVWKGLSGRETIVIAQEYQDVINLYGFQLGESYLVYGFIGTLPFSDDDEQFLQTNACHRTKPMREATEDLSALGEPSITIVKPTLWGQINATFSPAN